MQVATSVVMGREPTLLMREELNMSKTKQLVPNIVDQFDELDYETFNAEAL